MADMFYEMLYLQSAESLLSENMEFHLEAQIHIQYKRYRGSDLYQLCHHLAKKLFTGSKSNAANLTLAKQLLNCIFKCVFIV